MKRDDQILALRLQNEANRDRMVQNAKDRDRALAAKAANSEVPLPMSEMEDASSPDIMDPSKVIVIHPGSQNMRIGFASDALPRTFQMCLATRHPQTESEIFEALPRRQFEAKTPDQQYGEEWSKLYQKQSNDLKIDMRANKRKVLPNSKELVMNYNRRTEPERIPVHNDPLQVDWTDIAEEAKPGASSTCFTGYKAQRIPDDSNPKYRLWWPFRSGWLNEDDYPTAERLYGDIEAYLESIIRTELGLNKSSEWAQYSCVLIIPDLYDKRYVEMMLRSLMVWFKFSRVCFIQESMAATFGAGYTQACVVDVGAQKTSIACVEDGLCMEDSRINLKYGGFDITETLIKMMLYDNFPYQDINLQRRYDFLLAEELKTQHCTMSQANISVQLAQFHLRAPNQPTHKYQFKTYDEVILAPMGVFDPAVFDNSTKLRGRRKLIDRSYNAYDVDIPDDPSSGAQVAILGMVKPSIISSGLAPQQNDASTPVKEKPHPFNFSAKLEAAMNGTPITSNAPSPAPDGTSTPVHPPFIFGRDNTNGGSPAPSGYARLGGTPAPNGPSQATLSQSFHEGATRTAKSIAVERDTVLPVAPLDTAVLTSIQYAARGDEKKFRDLLGSVMVVGGGAKVPHFTNVLEERLKAKRPDLADRILVSRSARDMDEQVVVWKGASVFAKLPTNDSWIVPLEYERLGARAIHHKVLWSW